MAFKNTQQYSLFDSINLPCGVTLKNRIAKAAMSDSLGDGTGRPTEIQEKLYHHWAMGGSALSIIGEVQGNNLFAEKPGNLLLNRHSSLESFKNLVQKGAQNNCHLWVQLGHAGALSYPLTSTPKGPSAIDLPELKCAELARNEIEALPDEFAQTAKLAKSLGFGGVEIHAAHGFLISQFLSPLFNKRKDEYGGGIASRMLLLMQVIKAVRASVGTYFPIGVKLNSSDLLEGGLTQNDSLSVISALDKSDIDLIDISGGTYFPHAKSASDSAARGAYFIDFAKKARALTTKPLMATGGFKTYTQAQDAIESGVIDIVGIARALVLEPNLPNLWKKGQIEDVLFPTFDNPPEGGVTAWYTMQLTNIGKDNPNMPCSDLSQVIKTYENRDLERAKIWNNYFNK